MIIRNATSKDAKHLSSLIQEVERESNYMLYGADERIITPEQLSKRIQAFQGENSAILVADQEGRLVGYLFAIGGTAKRTKHSVYLAIGILKDYRGKGIGSKLFEYLDVWAKEKSIHRLELTVVTKNQAGLALYEKSGFEIEGTKRDSLFINGEYVDEYYMSKLV